MPIYQYKCIGCNLTTEKIQSKPLSIAKCEHCNGLAERTVELPGYRRDHTMLEG